MVEKFSSLLQGMGPSSLYTRFSNMPSHFSHRSLHANFDLKDGLYAFSQIRHDTTKQQFSGISKLYQGAYALIEP